MAKAESSPEFFNEAECRKRPLDMYPSPTDRLAEADAIAVCLGCTVMDECLTWALAHKESMGVWGGRTESERRTIARKIQRNDRLRDSNSQ